MTIQQLLAHAKSTTIRLAASYLLIIMLMSVGFSTIFYSTSFRELGRQLPPPSSNSMNQDHDNDPRFFRTHAVDQFLQDRIDEGRQALLQRLILLNIAALIGGGALSYYLARRTLKPIEDNMEAQAQFVSDASHELRTPLTALQTVNEVALRKATVSSKYAKDIFTQNIEEVVKLKTLTDSLLRLSQQDKLSLQLTAVSLQEVAGDAMNSVLRDAQAKGMSIKDTVPKVMVLADKTSLTQAVSIVLENAIKYSPAKSMITLTGGSQGGSGYIAVSDQGPGIAEQDLPHIFDRFYRADQARNKQNAAGYGIGLALAKKIMNQHDGSITTVSTPDSGATFTLDVPLSKL